MSIPAIKAVGIGLGPEAASRPGLARPRRDRHRRRVARDRARAADQQRRRPRGRRHQRRGPARLGLHEADLDADEAAPLRRPGDDDRGAGGDRAQRRLRRARRGGRRRGDGGARARRRAARAVRRRFGRRPSSARWRPRTPPCARARAGVSPRTPDDSTDPAATATRPLHEPAADGHHVRRRPAAADRRHDRDDVRGARRRAGGHAGRRAAARVRRRSLGRPQRRAT